jgi:hypothetical protein
MFGLEHRQVIDELLHLPRIREVALRLGDLQEHPLPIDVQSAVEQ